MKEQIYYKVREQVENKIQRKSSYDKSETPSASVIVADFTHFRLYIMSILDSKIGHNSMKKFMISLVLPKDFSVASDENQFYKA